MLERKAVNTGRQIEFDYMKGWFTPMILLIHSFQMLVGAGEHVDGYKILYIIATMTGSAIFMFVFGPSRFDTTYVVAELCGGGFAADHHQFPIIRRIDAFRSNRARYM